MTTKNAGEKEQGMSDGPYRVERTAVIGPRHSAECGSVVAAELVCRCSNTAHRNATAAAARRVRELEEALEHVVEYWNRGENDGAMSDALYHMIETAEAALAGKERTDGAE